jgi:predicted nuclease of predicted toxin-antitoxin system
LPIIGFTDLSILQAAKEEKLLVLTDDGEAADLFGRAGCDVLKMNYLRFGEV